MRILRHAQMAVTMEIYAQASSKSTQDALKRLGDSLQGGGQLLYSLLYDTRKAVHSLSWTAFELLWS